MSQIENQTENISKENIDKPPKVYHEGAVYCLYDDTRFSDFSPQLLDPEYWQKQNQVTGQVHGRGITWFVNYQSDELVLRHYYRGGLVGKINNDSYWFQSYETTRAVAEYHLLLKLSSLGLPVPVPMACRVIKGTLFYSADLLMSRIKNAHDLVAILPEKSLAPDLWQKIGTIIKQFHQQGVFHHDLNAHNILIDKNEKIWIIDFDKGEQRPINKAWQTANLERLKRSLLKEQNKCPGFNFQDSDFKQLLKGYDGS